MTDTLKAPVDLLWTGGWDSTYRLLDVALRHRYPIQPWYVLDRERASTGLELKTMASIRAAIARRDRGASNLIKNTIFVERDAIQHDEQIARVHSATALGSQYGWLPQFAKQNGLHGLELGSVAVAGGRMYELLVDNVERVIGKAGETYRVAACPSDARALLFRHFEFPILMLSKEDIRKHAVRYGFLDLMHLTWTCHSPRRGKPCGSCAPCMVMMQTNMAWRIPPIRRVRPLLRLAKREAQKRLSNWPT